ncbi:MAG TPA: c-type cytochrome [Blastocatellia bacterium]
MKKATIRRGATALAAIAAFALFHWMTSAQAQSAAQQPAQPQAAPQEKTVEQTRKNIQSLKGLPDSQLIPVMNMFSASLGVRCDFCHVRVGNEWAYDKDDKKAKQTARKMIEMTINLNKASFENRPEVSCFTCHVGHEHPAAVPPLPRALPPREEARRPAEAWPTPQQIVDKYIAAVGGKEAAAKLKTRVIKGSYVNIQGNTLPMEMWFEAPSKLLIAINGQQGTITQSLNGNAGSMKIGERQREMDQAEIARLRSLALGLDALQLKEPYPRMTFGGKEKIGDRDAFILRTITPDRKRVRLYFDAETGLLLRRYTLTDTPVGQDPEQIDFEDYRDVDGIKVPFSIRVSYLALQISATYKLAEVKHNVPIDESKFK